MICKNCGNFIPDSSQLCPICGTKSPCVYGVRNPYASPTSSTGSQPFPPLPQQQYPPSVSPASTPPYGGQPVAPPYAANLQAPYPNVYDPVPTTPTHHTRTIVLAIVLPVIALLLLGSVLFSSFFRSFPTGTIDSFDKGTEYNPYITGETVVATGNHYDSKLENCVCTSEIVLREFVTGRMAGQYMESLGADLSLLDAGEEYAVARFQVKLLSNNTPNRVYFGSSDFFFYDNYSQEFMDFYSYDFEINPESTKLAIGETGEVILFAVVPKNADLQILYYTENSYICFAPEGIV